MTKKYSKDACSITITYTALGDIYKYINYISSLIHLSIHPVIYKPTCKLLFPIKLEKSAHILLLYS